MGLIVRSSDLHAAGVFATTRISKGEQVVEYTGPRISQSEGSRLYDDRPITYLFALDNPELLIDGHGTAAFINHSCDPNCETEEIDGHVWICAIRNIQPGEEITYDYNLFDGEGDAPAIAVRSDAAELSIHAKKSVAASAKQRRNDSSRRRRLALSPRRSWTGKKT